MGNNIGHLSSIKSSVIRNAWVVIVLKVFLDALLIIGALPLLIKHVMVYTDLNFLIAGGSFVIGSLLIAPVSLLAVFAIYIDKNYVIYPSKKWDPSLAYYLVFAGPIGSVIGTFYLYNRFQRG